MKDTLKREDKLIEALDGVDDLGPEWLESIHRDGAVNCEPEVHNTLLNRGAVYGGYSDALLAETSMLRALIDMHKATHGTDMPLRMQIVHSRIIMKQVRLAATPDHNDSWLDIGGYAELARRELCE